jgi:UDP-N-acetylglucosamine--N-acetylmuramyl-(pentapeptide) pyrophosphoryl-undecaprenol N-acetylglucosamine transferase
MKIFLVGGGSGGHITPLLAVAHELKRLHPDVEIGFIMEQCSKFASLPQSSQDIENVYYISAGKFRRYPGRNPFQKLLDIKTFFLNVRDVFKVLKGMRESRKLLKRERPDGIFIKGGFVGVPVGTAAHKLGIPFFTHDSDTVPGMANNYLSKWAVLHATGMPAEYYNYPKEKTVFTGVPISPDFAPITSVMKSQYRTELVMDKCDEIIMLIGGSQGAQALNDVFFKVAQELLTARQRLGIINIAGSNNEESVARQYDQLPPDQRARVLIKGFVADVYRYSGASDVVLTRAGANSMAELAVQGQACIIVAAQLAGDHQTKNAEAFAKGGAAVVLDEKAISADPHLLTQAFTDLLDHPDKRQQLGQNLTVFGKPDAAVELAELIYRTFRVDNAA